MTTKAVPRIYRGRPGRGCSCQCGQELITAAAAISIGKRGFFRIALAGGFDTSSGSIRLLADDRDIDRKRWQLFFGDERCVAPTDPPEQLPNGTRSVHRPTDY